VDLPDQTETGSVDPHPVEYVEQASKPVCSDRVARLIGWNVEVLLRLLRQIVARRIASKVKPAGNLAKLHETLDLRGSFDGMILDEVKEIIELPQFDASAAKNQQDIDSVALDARVPLQLEDYLMTIGWGYRDNPCKYCIIHYKSL
jgi:hypothetical protein